MRPKTHPPPISIGGPMMDRECNHPPILAYSALASTPSASMVAIELKRRHTFSIFAKPDDAGACDT